MIRNIINSRNHGKKDLKVYASHGNSIIMIFKLFVTLFQISTARGFLTKLPAYRRVVFYPLQDPIKNIICHPE